MRVTTTSTFLLLTTLLSATWGSTTVVVAQEAESEKPNTSTANKIRHLDKETKKLKDENRQLKAALDSLIATVERLESRMEKLSERGGTLAIRDGVVMEYGSVLFDSNRKYLIKKIDFRNTYKSPPLVIVCESGTAGAWVFAKSQRITTKQAEIAVRDELWYRCRIGYLVIGQGTLQGERLRAQARARKAKDKKETSKRTPKPDPKKGKVILPEYSVLDERIIDVPAKATLELDVLISGQITKPGLRALLDKLFTIKRKTKFTHHSAATAVFIQAYTSKERCASQTGLWIAQLSWTVDEGKPSTKVREGQLRQLQEKAERKLSFSEKDRKRIYWEVVEAQYRATHEADKKHPALNPMRPGYSPKQEMRQSKKREALERRLAEKYTDEVAKKHGLTRKKLKQINREGMTEDWPVPPWNYGPPSMED